MRSNKQSQNTIDVRYLTAIPEIAKLLLEKDAKINARTSNGKTALWVARSNDHIDIVQLLEKTGAKEVEFYFENSLDFHSKQCDFIISIHFLIYEEGINI